MHFKFDVKLSEEEYIDYNNFLLFESPYNQRKILKISNIVISVILIFAAITFIFCLFFGVVSTKLLFYSILLLLLKIGRKPYLKSFVKLQIKSLKKKGKLPYSPVSTIEFYDDRLIETTEMNKTEQLYAPIERISIIEGKVIYIHLNNSLSYIIPLSSFESDEQFASFVEFIEEKMVKADVYKNNKQ